VRRVRLALPGSVLPDGLLAPWQTSAPVPNLTMLRERGTASIWALGNERPRVLAEGDLNVDRVIIGHRGARGPAQVGAAAARERVRRERLAQRGTAGSPKHLGRDADRIQVFRP
jgi:hypothetical protein